MIKFDQYRIFHAPVKKKEVPDYYDIIKNPIDLSSMKAKTKRTEYKKIDQFKEDVELLVSNARLYNGEGNIITVRAIELRDFCLEQIASQSAKLQEMEEQLQAIQIAI